MFSSTKLFNNVACPRSDRCEAVNCIFSHDPDVVAKSRRYAEGKDISVIEKRADEPAVKRRKLESPNGNDRTASVPSTLAPEAKSTEDKTVKPTVLRIPTSKDPRSEHSIPKTLEKPITPPPKVGKTGTKKPFVNATSRPKESLNPRTLPTPPAGHDKRCLYLRYIHEEIKRLNSLMVSSDRKDKAALSLDDQELITTSLNEEEKLASGNSAVYANHIKQRIGQLRKWKLDDWVAHLKATIFAPKTSQIKQPERPSLDLGLTTEQEWQVLQDQLLTPLDKLIQMGYVIQPPSPDAIEEARRTAVLSMNWEVCDRCKSRFQVFPERREEDGVLTTNGPCTYHWGKLRRPKREKTDAITGSKEAAYTCCGDMLDSTGCSSAESHVYKMQEPARMATVIPFINVPDNPTPVKARGGTRSHAITFDCEMGYTVHGLELIRLTAVSWPGNEEIMDVLVQPKGTILDFNSRFSGVFADTFKSAVKWSEGMEPLVSKEAEVRGSRPLPIVSSPEVARAILCSYMTPDTPLIGHALENDLNSVRLCHTKVVDTVALYPHPGGLPIRYGLKQLTSVHLGRDIQTGGEAGHDSLEDARATGDLVRVKVGRKWQEMKKSEIKA